MIKSDLKTGMWVETRDGAMCLVLKGEMETAHYGTQNVMFIREKAFDIGDNYNDDLLSKLGVEGCDIIRVYGNMDGNIVNNETYKFNKRKYKCIWERKEKVPFKLEYYKGEYVMACDTEEKAEEFCKFLHSKGRKWLDDEDYLDSAHWQDNREKTVYGFNEGWYANNNYAKNENYTILKFDDYTFDIPKYTDNPKDVKKGTIIEVSHDKSNWYKREFITMYNDCYICVSLSGNKFKSYQYARIGIE